MYSADTEPEYGVAELLPLGFHSLFVERIQLEHVVSSLINTKTVIFFIIVPLFMFGLRFSIL